jgi:hypothetical protein
VEVRWGGWREMRMDREREEKERERSMRERQPPKHFILFPYQ